MTVVVGDGDGGDGTRRCRHQRAVSGWSKTVVGDWGGGDGSR